MQKVLMVKLGEIVLKGLNRRKFEELLFKNIRWRLSPLGRFKYSYSQSTLYIYSEEEADASGLFDDPVDLADTALSHIYGIASITLAHRCPKEMAGIMETVYSCAGGELAAARTFKVTAKRSDKKFALKSPEICALAGGEILELYPHLKVDVKNPDLTVCIEIREHSAYVHTGSRPGAGGLPVGVSGRAMLLLSGGIDSPVAGCMSAKRGALVNAVHFHSYPYTSERAKTKVLELAGLMARWCGEISVNVVSFTKIQEYMRNRVPEDLFTIVMRRFMMRIAERLARLRGCDALVTGESLAQVASQTMLGLAATDSSVNMLTLRPLIGLDKNEIIIRARALSTFEKSIEPYEDCCAIFSPKHPDTKPKMDAVTAAESALPVEELIDEAVNTAERIIARYDEKTGISFKKMDGNADGPRAFKAF